MQHICNRYTTDMQSRYAIKICRQQCNKDMQYRYARGVQEQQEVCKNSKLGGASWEHMRNIYATDMQKICNIYATDMQRICNIHAIDIQQICNPDMQ